MTGIKLDWEPRFSGVFLISYEAPGYYVSQTSRGKTWEAHSLEPRKHLSTHATSWQAKDACQAEHFRRTCPSRDDGADLSPAERLARWAEEGPRLAKAAGCHVAITITEARKEAS